MNRNVQSFLNSKNNFFGYKKGDRLIGIIEIEANDIIHIQSLVIDPEFFRQGLASQLIDFMLDRYKNKTFTVETGAGNFPAVSLYQSYGFKEVEKYNAEFNIIKIRFELKVLNS